MNSSPEHESSASEPADAPDAGLPNQEIPDQRTRTIVNFLLFIHLFTVGVLMLFAGSDSGLRGQLRRVPGYYLQALGMDFDFDSGQRYNMALQYDEIKQRLASVGEHLKYIEKEPEVFVGRRKVKRRHLAETDLNFVADRQKQVTRNSSFRGQFHLTHGGELDAPYFVELRYRRGGEDKFIRLPNDNIWPHQRYLRYQMLAREVGRLAGAEGAEDILPRPIIKGMIMANDDLSIHELSQLEPRLVCRRRITPKELMWQTNELGRRPPSDASHDFWFRTVYQRIPLVVSGRIRLNKVVDNLRDYAPPAKKTSSTTKQP